MLVRKWWPGYTGAGYIILDPITGEGAYRISGGGNGGSLFTALSFLLNTISIFIGVLESIAKTLGTILPQFQQIARFLEVAKFVHKMLENSMKCENGSQTNGLASFLIATSILSISVVAIVSKSNPVLGVGVGVITDSFFDWVLNQSVDCK